MGIRFSCPNGHKLNVKEHLAGKRGICPSCGAKFTIPATSESDGGPVIIPTTAAETPAAGFPKVAGETRKITDTGSVSVVIPVIEPPAPPIQSPAPTTAQPTEAAAAPPEINITPVPTAPTVSAPPPASVYAARRERRRRLQMRIAALLLVAVVVLAIVLFWVLSRGPAEPAAMGGWDRGGTAAQPWSTELPALLLGMTNSIPSIESSL